MAQKLYIHIGMPKTGTTSAQAFMWANRKKLAGLGFYYPDTMRPPKPVQAQHTFLNVYIRQQNQAHAETGKPLAYEAVDVMVKEIKEANCPVNLISEEQLSFDANVTAPFLGRFKEHFDVKIIVFLRRQDVWVESMYAQAIRQGFRAKFTHFIGNRITQERLDVARFIAIWAGVFGSENIIVVPYVEKKTRTDKEILAIIGAPADPGFVTPDRHNVSLSKEAILFIQKFPKLERRTYWKMNQIYGDALRELTKPWPLVFLTREERRQLLATYAESNAAVARDYLEPRGTPKALFEIDEAKFPPDEQALAGLDRPRRLELFEGLARAVHGEESVIGLPAARIERERALEHLLHENSIVR